MKKRKQLDLLKSDLSSLNDDDSAIDPNYISKSDSDSATETSSEEIEENSEENILAISS